MLKQINSNYVVSLAAVQRYILHNRSCNHAGYMYARAGYMYV